MEVLFLFASEQLGKGDLEVHVSCSGGRFGIKESAFWFYLLDDFSLITGLHRGNTAYLRQSESSSASESLCR